MTEEERQVELTGGSPWGFSIQGGADFGAPLKVTKVSPGGKAATAGVQLNDILKRISDRSCGALRHSEALYLIRISGASLSLVLQNGRAAPAPYQPERHLIRSATAPSTHRASRSPPKPSPLQRSPVRSPPSRGESVGGPLSSSGEEKTAKTPPQPIKAKPRCATQPGPSNGSGPLSPPSPPQQDPLPPVPSDPVPQASPVSPVSPAAPGVSGRGRSGPKRRRELKPPPAASARGLYDFNAETKHELSFRKGDQLRLLRTVDDNWLEAQLGDRKGIIPVSYVELYAPQGEDRDPAAPHAVARYEFLAEESYELGFEKGAQVALLSRVDDNWLQGRVGDRTGIFPAAFVDIITPLPDPQPPADPISVENEIRTHQGSPVAPSGELYRAVYSYSPQNEDELALAPGTEVHVVRRCEDGWFMGYDGSTGAFGTFPGNYVQLI